MATKSRMKTTGSRSTGTSRSTTARGNSSRTAKAAPARGKAASKTAGSSTRKASSTGATRKSSPATSTRRRSSTNAMNQDMPNSQFHELFMNELKDIYWAEKNLFKALGKMKKAATAEELSSAIDEHQQVTQTHIDRLEQVFELMGQAPKAKKCEAMSGLIEEGQEVIEETEEGPVRDAGIIICSQKIEHYEIAAYGSLRTLASKMGHNEAAQLFEQTLGEEKEADSKLTQIAESSVNEEASAQ
jgi:ferritin-like metal-binding protein YciE